MPRPARWEPGYARETLPQGADMLARIRAALAARHAAIIEAEAMVARGDRAALRRAMDLACDEWLPEDKRGTTSGSLEAEDVLG